MGLEVVYTLTLNPAIDYLLTTDKPLDTYQRLADYDLIASGKGINVSLQLQQLKKSTLPIAVIGQATGLAYKAMLNQQFKKSLLIEAPTLTRINVKINAGGKTMELNTTGRPIASYDFVKKLCSFIKDHVKSSDTFAILGSIPYQMPPARMLPILKAIKKQKASFLIDMRGKHVLDYGFMQPELIKPNVEELGEFFDEKPKTYQQIKKQCEKLLEMGFKRVLVSQGKHGSLYFDRANSLRIEPLKLKDVNSAGAGDAMVAGFIAGLQENRSVEGCVRLAAACASGKVVSAWYPDLKLVRQMEKKIVIRRL